MQTHSVNNMSTRNYSIFIVLLYMWIIITNPQSHFQFLAKIHFERIVMLLAWLVLIFTNKIRIRMPQLSLVIIVFYLSMLVSYFLSPYHDFFQVQWWLENYWKYIILYFLILFSINNLKDISYLFIGFVIILVLYQLHSWIDFLQGGSYVWQAGMKRIVGVWSSGIGAANYYGMITLISLPFALFWYRATEKNYIKTLIIGYFIVTSCSILFSGTRGALLGLIFFILINVRKVNHVKIVLLMVTILTLSSILLMPDYLKQRYFGLIPFFSVESNEIGDRFEEQAKKSALGRLTGLTDGWKLVKQKPFFGYGPGSSPMARKHVNKELLFEEEYDYQMHNLYGQVLAETGFIGTILFIVQFFIYFYQLRIIESDIEIKSNLYNYKLTLQNTMLLLLFYGIASHTLYRFYWFLLFAAQGALISMVSSKSAVKQPISPL